jgi:hypothetical protein
MKEYVALVKSVSYIWKILKLSSRNHLWADWQANGTIW